jgi:hypothetical protein
MAKLTFVFIAGTLLTILAAGSVLMAFLSTATRSVSTEASEVAANFSSTFLKTTFAVIILIAIVFVLTGRKLPL